MKLTVCTLLLVLAMVQRSVALEDILCKVCPVACKLIPHEEAQKICTVVCTTLCKPNYRDLVAMAKAEGRHVVPLPLKWDFYDLNEDDLISPDELSAAISVDKNNPGFLELFKLADQNGDGFLSKKEFYSGPFVFESDLDEAEYERCKAILGIQG